MKKILYVEKTARAYQAEDIPKVNSLLQTTKSLVLEAIKSDFKVEQGSDFGEWAIRRLEKGFHGLVTHFPYDRSFCNNPDFFKLKGEAFFSEMYRSSVRVMKEIRRRFPNLAVVVYTGASTEGGDGDSSNSPIHKVISNAGANRIIYRSNDLITDAREVHRCLFELISKEATPITSTTPASSQLFLQYP